MYILTGGLIVNIDLVWQRIIDCEGQEFTQIRGKKFAYEVRGSSIILSTTNRSISKTEIEKALLFVPLENTIPVQHLQAPSYIYSILMDTKIRNNLW